MHTHRLALLCGGAAFALTPPARRIAAKRTYAINAAVLPTEACVALLYGAAAARWHYHRQTLAPYTAQQSTQTARRAAARQDTVGMLLVLAYACVPPPLECFFFVASASAYQGGARPRSTPLPRSHAPAPPRCRGVARAPRTREVLAALWASARAKDGQPWHPRGSCPWARAHAFRAG